MSVLYVFVLDSTYLHKVLSLLRWVHRTLLCWPPKGRRYLGQTSSPSLRMCTDVLCCLVCECIMWVYSCIQLCIVLLYCPSIDRICTKPWQLFIWQCSMSLSCFVQGGFTPFIISAAQGHSEVVCLLCQRGVNIEARDDVSWQPYYIIVAMKVYMICMDACMYRSIYQHR